MAIFMIGCDEETTSVTQSSFSPYKQGEKVTLKSVAGGEVTLIRDEKGFKIDGSSKILMFDIFGTYCDPCRAEAPHLMDFQLKNSENFMMIGLIHFEDISDEQVLNTFTKKYNAYYFISNSKENDRLISQILDDISYKHALSIPFKVVLKDGKYQNLTNLAGGSDVNYYLGAVSTDTIQKDFNKITQK